MVGKKIENEECELREEELRQLQRELRWLQRSQCADRQLVTLAA
jgi:hypothetical protein